MLAASSLGIRLSSAVPGGTVERMTTAWEPALVRIASPMRGDDMFHRFQGHAAVRGAGRADRDEGHVGLVDGGGHVVGGRQPSLPHGVADQVVDGFLDDRRPAGAQHRQFFGRDIDADHVMAKFGQAPA